MRWPSRRHRGSQAEAPTPVYRIRSVAPDTDPVKVAQEFAAAFTDRIPADPRTARQVLTASLLRDEFLGGEVWDPAWVEALVDRLMLDLGEAGLEIVAREDVE